MAKNKPTTVNEDEAVAEEIVREVSGKVVNPRDIEWPLDVYGFTSMLKKEGVRAVGRIKGDEAKLEVLMKTLRCLAQHAEMKIGDQRAEAEQTQAAAKNRQDAEYARSVAEQEREVGRLENLLDSAKKALKAKKAMPEGTNTEGK